MLANTFLRQFSRLAVFLCPMEPVVKTVFGNSNALSNVQDPKRRVGIDEFIGCRSAEIEVVADVFDGVRDGCCGFHVVRSFVFCVTQCFCVHCSITKQGIPITQTEISAAIQPKIKEPEQ